MPSLPEDNQITVPPVSAETPAPAPPSGETPFSSPAPAPEPVPEEPEEPKIPLAPFNKEGETPAPTPASTPSPAQEPPTVQTQTSAPAENPSRPFYSTDANALADKQGGIMGLLMKAKEKIQFRKRAKLEKIMGLAREKTKITNDDVQKLLRCSDATATRYLSELAKQGRLRLAGIKKGSIYEFVH